MLSFCDTGGHIGDAGNAQHLQPQVVGGNGFRHSGHADGIRPQGPIGSDLGGGLVAGTREDGVDPLLAGDPQFGGGRFCQRPQAQRVCLGHIREARAEALVIRAHK